MWCGPINTKIKVAFASGTDDLNVRLIAHLRRIFPELPLYVVSEFPPAESGVVWVRYQGGLLENWARCRSVFHGKSIRLAGVLLVPGVPFRRMRLLALLLAPFYFLAVNENLNDFMLRPRSLPAIARHFAWRLRNFLRWHFRPAASRPPHRWRDLRNAAARIAGRLRYRRAAPLPSAPTVPGVSMATVPRGSGYAASVNRIVVDAPRDRICLLDHEPDPAFLDAFDRAFLRVPGLFCAIASGGHADGDGWRYVSHGAGCCSQYDTAKFRALGGLGVAHETSEAAFLDLCSRAWQRGWPTVSVAGACRESRGGVEEPASLEAPARPRAFPDASRDRILALAGGAVAVFPGKPATGKPRVLVASAYVPFPLSHGGAVRIHNLTARALAEWDQILVAFAETAAPPAPELLERFVEVVLVRRAGSHRVPSRGRPEVVEHFASAAFRAALRETVRKWQPAIAQLEFTQMAQYAADCLPARTILVEHDITFDLYQQMHRDSRDWDLRRQLKLWRRFETAAWRTVSCVVTMSEKDRALVSGTRAVTLPNGVDLRRFQPAARPPEPRRLLFVGSFSHLPNLMAAAFFLDEVWPHLRDARLHIIAGARHQYFLEYHAAHAKLNLPRPGVEVEGFVSDVREAYERAAVVVAPLVVSAGTNLKILEALACGRPVVSTLAGVNGLDLVAGRDFVLVHTAAEMAAAIEELLASPDQCRRLAAAGRRRMEEDYGWDEIARRQSELYRALMAP